MGIPNTSTATSHAIAIRAGGVTVGMIQSWAPSQSRTVTPVYELNPATTGEIIENVPGNVAGTTIQVSRYDLFSTRMEERPEAIPGPRSNSFFLVIISWLTIPATIQDI